MSFIVIDLETTIVESFGRKANPFDPRNRVVMLGFAEDMDEPKELTTSYDEFFTALHTSNILVGFNIKFDLLYLWNDPRLQEWIAAGGKIWDCQLVEYILSGQFKQYISLDKCSLQYGGTLKDDRIKKYWEAGTSTELIPQDLLQEYLKHDVLNTRLVYLQQLRKCKSLNLFNLITTQMNALLATTEMEYNGLKVNTTLCARYLDILKQQLKDLDSTIEVFVRKNVSDWPPEVPFNGQSPQDVSLALFGGELKAVRREVIGVYKSGIKNGLDRVKKHAYAVTIKGFGLKANPTWASKIDGIYSVADGVLSLIAKNTHPASELAKLILNRRSLNKQISSYFEKMIDLATPDDIIHHQLVHVGTKTGRLSSKNPNSQNITRTED